MYRTTDPSSISYTSVSYIDGSTGSFNSYTIEFLGIGEARLKSIAAVPENMDTAKEGRCLEKESRGYGLCIRPGKGSAMPPSKVEFRKLSDIEVRE
jgi:hypothetical protein